MMLIGFLVIGITFNLILLVMGWMGFSLPEALYLSLTLSILLFSACFGWAVRREGK